MFKNLLAAILAFAAASVFAASVDVNKASQAELEAIKGVGPGIASKMLEERKKSQFKDWPDLIERVKGLGETKAAALSADGLTVNGSEFKASTATAKKSAKQDKKAEKAAEGASKPTAKKQ